MSTETVATAPPATYAAKQSVSHPLAPLSASEITAAASLIRGSWPARTDLQFKAITLEEPLKSEVLPYLEAEYSGKPLPRISRKAFLNYYIRNTVSCDIMSLGGMRC
jgi:primary-amine oxidase